MDFKNALQFELKVFRDRLLALREQAQQEINSLNVAIENTNLKLEKAEAELKKLENTPAENKSPKK